MKNCRDVSFLKFIFASLALTSAISANAQKGNTAADAMIANALKDKPLIAKNILNVRLIDSPVSLNWTAGLTLTEAPIVINLCDGLFGYDYKTKKAIPEIAESVTKSKDLTEYTFTIRKDAKWSDGRPIYAQDFVNGWLQTLSPQSTSIYTYYLFDIKNAEEYNAGKIQSIDEVGIKAIGDQILKVKLKRPHQNWEYNTTFWPLFPIRKDKLEKFGANWWRAGVLVSSGAFILDSYEQGKKIVLKRNPYYKPNHQRALTNLDEIDIYFMLDQKEARAKYESGFFSFLSSLPLESMRADSKRSDYHTLALARHHIFALNSEKYPMNNKDFRFALLEAVDPAKMIPKDAINLSLAKTLIPPPLVGSKTPQYVKFDVADAKERLKKSGVVFTPGFQIKLLTIISEPYFSIAKSIQKQLLENLKLNIEVATLQNQEYTAYMNLGDYHATLISWTSKVLNSQDFLLPYSNLAAHSRVKVPGTFYDQWILNGIQADTTAKAEHDFGEAQKVVTSTEAVINPLFFETSGYLQHSNIQNLEFNQMGLPILKSVFLK